MKSPIPAGSIAITAFATFVCPAHADELTAVASPAAADPAQIVVTARRRTESVQDVPASISVVGGDVLTATQSVNLNQVTQLVPALNYSSPNPRNTAFTIRGLGSSVVAISQANDGLEPGVGFYVDQVYHARPATAAFDFTDIDQIEVLRGPQGTVFGKNTTAGCQRRSKSRPCGGVKPGHRVTCRGEWREGVARGPLPPALA